MLCSKPSNFELAIKYPRKLDSTSKLEAELQDGQVEKEAE